MKREDVCAFASSFHGKKRGQRHKGKGQRRWCMRDGEVGGEFGFMPTIRGTGLMDRGLGKQCKPETD